MFDDLKISNDHPQPTNASKCKLCNKKQKLYCSFCGVGENHPFLKLPITAEIYRHPSESKLKSTACHLKILTGNEVYEYDGLERLKGLDPTTTCLLYPSDEALEVSELPPSIKNLIVIDGTWRQAKQVLKDIKTLKFHHVKIKNQKTRFWRFQNLSENYLATIEAIYYFFVEYYEAFESNGSPYDGRYDNLLFYFKLNYDLIQDYYNNNRQKQFTRQHRFADSFISYRESEKTDSDFDETKLAVNNQDLSLVIQANDLDDEYAPNFDQGAQDLEAVQYLSISQP